MAIGTAIIATVAIAQAVSGIAQYYQQKKAANASEKELNEIKRSYDALVPPDFDMDIEAPPELIAESAQVVDYDFTKMTPDEYKVVGQFAPEIAPYIAEQNPELVKDTAVGAEGLEAQMEALRKFQDIGEGGFDPQFAQRMKEAQTGAQQAAQSRQESILQDYQRRGLLGSGTQLAAELSGAEGAMQRAGDMSSDAATQAYLNQLDALRTSADLGGNVRGQELDLASRNANIANAYNQRTSRDYQNYLQNAATTRNRAAANNLATRQGISNMNTEEKNRAAVRERDRGDILKERIREQKIGNTRAENDATLQNWLNKLKVQDIKNNLEQQKFGNEVTKLGDTAQAGMNRVGAIQNRADLDSRAIGAGADAITTGATAYGQGAVNDRRNKRADKYLGLEWDEENQRYR